ncbi:DUF2637 domain-containing protein [Streptomyces sp. NBC_01244]|uniref:DUF2637 domain-containing protein n=1 Tax=Streptomyces sp. NBC_01244 TaxID=2903797 RepID=UPI002E12397B|nr:DUF2637 domain-containing protein [Streptomyces sp. NBC_01244]
MTSLALPVPPHTLARRTTTWDRAAILTLGAAGCALSYDALQQMAVAIHVRGLLTYLFPLVIDGFIAYGVRALLLLHAAPFRARLYVWALFGTATIASIWANALHAIRLNQQGPTGALHLSDTTVGILSTLAPLALAGAVHLHILITRQPASEITRSERDEPSEPVPGRRDHGLGSSQQIPGASEARQLDTSRDDNDEVGTRPFSTEPPQHVPKRRVGRPASAELDELIEIGKAVTGKITRGTVATAIRSAGHTVSDKRLTEVMAELKPDRR